jgi:ABC-type antimicrobial peptide transport system permease subunit
MRFGRFFAVVVLFILCGGAFGSAVGGLVGYAVPSSLKVFFGEVKKEKPPAPGELVIRDSETTIGVAPQKGLPWQGAALGGAAGLVLGLLAGIFLAAVDQVITAIREHGRPPGAM